MCVFVTVANLALLGERTRHFWYHFFPQSKHGHVVSTRARISLESKETLKYSCRVPVSHSSAWHAIVMNSFETIDLSSKTTAMYALNEHKPSGIKGTLPLFLSSPMECMPSNPFQIFIRVGADPVRMTGSPVIPIKVLFPWHLTMAPKSISASSRAVAEAQISQAEQHMKTPDPVSALPLYEAAAVVLPRAAVAAGRILLAGGKIPVDRNAAIAHFRAAKTNRSNAGALELSKCLRSHTDRSKRDESIIILRELMTKNVLEAPVSVRKRPVRGGPRPR